MKASELIALFERMADEHWAYAWGAAREGCVDCSGAFTYAFGKFGQSIEHGSNTIARRRIQGGMRPSREARPGWAVFKWREANDSMPAKYVSDGLGDFYHIGLLAADGKSVLNAKGEAYGFCRDPLSGATGAAKWAYAAPLKGVTYDEGSETGMEETLCRAMVVTEKDPLRVRDWPVTGRILGYVPRGSAIDVLNEGTDGWPRIRYGELVGYVSGAYLTRVYETEATPLPSDDAPPESGSSQPGDDSVRITLVDAQAIYEALSEAQRLLSNIIGRGLKKDLA